MPWTLVFLTLLVGTFLPTQAGINSQLARYLGHPLLAACVSFASGTLALVALTAIGGIDLPTSGIITRIPWYLWTGGLLGAVYLSATIFLAPVLGAATTIGLIVAGQMLASIALDHFGLVGFPQHPLSLWRSVGAILLIFGVALILRS